MINPERQPMEIPSPLGEISLADPLVDRKSLRGNVPQNLTDAVTVVFATPRSDRGKGGMKGMSLGTGRDPRVVPVWSERIGG